MLQVKVLTACLLTISASTWMALAAPVVVTVNPSTPSFTTGQMFSIDLNADIPDPVLGFGLDFNFNPAMLALNSILVGPSWLPATGTEANDIVGLAFPSPISGTNITLATATFTALVTGTTTFDLAFDSSNLTEGFPLASGGFAPNNLIDEAVVTTPVPEPAGLPLSGTTLIALLAVILARNWRYRKSAVAL